MVWILGRIKNYFIQLLKWIKHYIWLFRRGKALYLKYLPIQRLTRRRTSVIQLAARLTNYSKSDATPGVVFHQLVVCWGGLCSRGVRSSIRKYHTCNIFCFFHIYINDLLLPLTDKDIYYAITRMILLRCVR